MSSYFIEGGKIIMVKDKCYNLQKFRQAQKEDYPTALLEIRSGKKRSHWIWYIFPQIAGLGFSETSIYYAIQDIDEARLYLEDDLLRNHILEICGALLELKTDNATSVMGSPDDMKLRSSMTLFAAAAPQIDVFQKVLDKYFNGKKDEKTIAILEGME